MQSMHQRWMCRWKKMRHTTRHSCGSTGGGEGTGDKSMRCVYQAMQLYPHFNGGSPTVRCDLHDLSHTQHSHGVWCSLRLQFQRQGRVCREEEKRSDSTLQKKTARTIRAGPVWGASLLPERELPPTCNQNHAAVGLAARNSLVGQGTCGGIPKITRR